MLGILITLALVSDIKTKKIKNAIVVPFILYGLLWNLYNFKLTGLTNSLLGIVFPIIVLFPFFYLKMLGAGDVKLFCAIGAINGIQFVINNMICSFLAGGIIALLLILVRKNLLQRLGKLFIYLKFCILSKTIQPYEKGITTGTGSFRFAFAVMIGLLVQNYLGRWNIY